MRYWSTLPHTTLAQTSAWLAKMLASPQNGTTEFVVCLRRPTSAAPAPSDPLESSEAGPEVASQVIGKIGIWRGTEIGFFLHRDYWRQGLIREALEALLPYYFKPVEEDGRGLEVITADTDPRNGASIGFLKGFGFEVTGTEERTFQVGPYEVLGVATGGEGGEWVDSVYLALKREVWTEREKESSGKEVERRKDGSRESV